MTRGAPHRAADAAPGGVQGSRAFALGRITGTVFVIIPALAPTLAALACAVVVLGATLGLRGAGHSPTNAAASLGVREAMLLAKTVGIATLIGALAACLGAPAGWAMRRLPAPWAALLLAPALLPSYLVYASWSLLRAPGTGVGDWLFRFGGPRLLQDVSAAQAIGGLALWASPLAAMVIGLRARALSNDAVDALRASGATRLARWRAIGGAMWRPCVAGGGGVALVMLGSAVPLHVAQVGTYSIEVWRRMDETAGSPGAWLASAPMALLAVAVGACGALLVRRPGAADAQPRSPSGGERDARVSARWVICAIAVWALAVVAPMALFLWSLRERASLGRFWSQAGEAAAESGAIACATGALVWLIAASTSAGFGSARPRTKAIAAGTVGAWLALGFMPGAMIGAAIARVGATPGGEWLTSGPAGVVTAHLARFGFVGAIAGWWLALREPTALREMRLLAGGGARVWWRGAGRAQRMGLAAAGVAGATLSFHEIESAALVAAPGRDTLPRHMLALLHYLRVEELNAGAAQLMALGLAGSAIAALLAARGAQGWRRFGSGSGWIGSGGMGSGGATALALVCAVSLIAAPGCGKVSARGAEVAHKADVRVAFGETGMADGQFVYPRAIDFDPTPSGEGSVWVIDKTARVQRLTLSGAHLGGWRMPQHENGKPTGVTLGPDGMIYVPDTHYQRVQVYTREGALVLSFGEYGSGPGQFIYPTDIALTTSASGAVDRIYVSEYGGNDRISCFGAAGAFLFSFGREGSGDSTDVEFSRPQSIAWDGAKRRLLVTDAGNHRLGVFDEQGALIRWIGKRDPALGPVAGDPREGDVTCFNYPYGLALLADGSAVVSEFGGGRAQRVDPDSGECLGVYGSPGRDRGRFAYPWAVAAGAVDGGAQWVYVLDSGNGRVQGFTVKLREGRGR